MVLLENRGFIGLFSNKSSYKKFLELNFRFFYVKNKKIKKNRVFPCILMGTSSLPHCAANWRAFLKKYVEVVGDKNISPS